MKLKHCIDFIINLPNKVYNFIIIKYRKIIVGKKIRINGRLFVRGKGKITLGDYVTINSSLKSNPIGGDSKTILYAYKGAEIKIGNNVGISNASIVSKEKVYIGDWVKIGGGVKIYDTDFHSLNYNLRRMRPDPDISNSSIVIKDDVFIGAHSIILKGVTIGEKSIIAAGSIVTKNIPERELWGGTPAKYIISL